MTYIPHTEEDRRKMLAAIGVERLEDLYAEIPESVRFTGDLPLPPALSQLEVEREIGRIANENLQGILLDSFLGGGVYDHYIPPQVTATLGRPEFYSAYTPYQAEVSQGTLQAMFEFQTMVCRLTGMDLANASMYDGASALVEGVWMAATESRKRTKVIVPRSLHPRYRGVLRTHLGEEPLTIVEIPVDGEGRIDQGALRAALDDETAVVIAQNPNYFGVLEELEELAKLTHGAGALFLQVFEPLSLGLVQSPADVGADIAVAEGQALGVPMNYGGPMIGLFTCKEKFLRKMPGRLAGITEDADGERAFTLTLQTREQHIRRGKATSNICTNQQLLAMAALVHLASLGEGGFRRAALLTQERSLRLRDGLSKAGVKLTHPSAHFREFVATLPAGLVAELRANGIVPGIALEEDYPELPDAYLITTTEKTARDSIDRFSAIAARWAGRKTGEINAESSSV
ncbi:MAG: aminomethyl-transferring glycine dehydrogenase subunit GcvPA [Gemmatimonadetes bacterium]|nr:aminomethyl-transferring glycine dehydrogenase subunit GcvPA [Gemmatimonadota bacterium]